MFNILVIEDDFSTRKYFNAILKANGFKPFLAENSAMALDIMEKQYIDLVITDIMMPGMDGFTLTEHLRDAYPSLPILIVSAKETVQDKRKGFLAGTDDYMVKPVDEEEMILRVKALLRRAMIASERRITIGGVTLNYDSLTVTKGNEQSTLPQKEFYLLFKLLSYPETIFTRIQLLDEIWGYETESDDSTVTVHVNRLRERFAGWHEFEIVTVRGLGYKAVRCECANG